jgi:Anti-sigma-K factor rskA/Putative zinc-finger
VGFAVSGDERLCPRTEDAVAFALHALEPDEEAMLREHLAGCRSCQATVADTELAAAAWGAAVEQVDPPARLRENILAQAAHTTQTGAGPTPDAAGAAGPAQRAAAPGRAAGSGPRRSPAGMQHHPGRGTSGPGRRRRVAAVLALVAVAVVVAVGGLAAYAVGLQQQRDVQIGQNQALVDVLTQLDRPGTSHATLSTSEGQPVAVVVTTTAERMVMMAGLSPNDRTTSVYVLWGVSTDAGPQPIGTFDVDPARPGPLVRQLGPPDPGPQSFLGYAISLEPGRDAPPAPTTVVASGQA